MLSRPHPTHGWLYLQPADWRSTLQRQVEERDRLDDITHSGPSGHANLLHSGLPALLLFIQLARRLDLQILI
jgi:hypothetical protein